MPGRESFGIWTTSRLVLIKFPKLWQRWRSQAFRALQKVQIL